MLRSLSLVAVLSAALFAGAALYINIAEQPARLTLDTRAAAAQWAPSYLRATRMQAPFGAREPAVRRRCVAESGGTGWLVAALLIGLVVPFTFIAIMPTNKSLLLRGRDLASPDTRALLERWGRLHAVRTALSLVATVLYLWLLSGA